MRLSLARSEPPYHAFGRPTRFRALRERLRNAGEVEVVQAPASALITEGHVEPLIVECAAVDELEAFPQHVRNAGLVIVEGVLDDETAACPEDARLGYVDADGRAWLPGMDRTPLSRTDRRRFERSRPVATGHLGPDGTGRHG